MSKPTDMDRRQVLKTFGALAGVPVLHLTHHPLVPVQDPEEVWKPSVLDTRRHETVSILVELIVPETDTPGARAALVDQYVDYALSQESSRSRQAFFKGLEWLDRHSEQRFGSPFARLEPEDQIALLTPLSEADDPAGPNRVGIEFFRDLKEKTIVGYYTSEVGMYDEMGYDGNDFLTEFKGCTHSRHLDWEPSK